MHVELTGTLNEDGTLTLDRRPELPAGPVRVRVEVAPPPFVPPKDDPFWQRMQAIWDGQKARGFIPRTAEEVEAEREETRNGWEERQVELERIQEEAWAARQAAKEAK